MNTLERIEYVTGLMIQAANENDSEALIRYFNVIYFLYKELAEERGKEIIRLRRVG